MTAGVAAILAQFPIDHFRSMGWYNVILGVLYVLLLFAMFHGERKCHCDVSYRKQGCTVLEKTNLYNLTTLCNVQVPVILVSFKFYIHFRYTYKVTLSTVHFYLTDLQASGYPQCHVHCFLNSSAYIDILDNSQGINNLQVCYL